LAIGLVLKRMWFLVLAVASLTATGPAAEDVAVRGAIEAYHALYYRTACAQLERAVAGAPLSRDDRVAALAYLARCLAVLDQPRAARRRFAQLLHLAPDSEVERRESPRIREAFDAAKLEVGERQLPRSGRDPVSDPAPDRVPESASDPVSPDRVGAAKEPVLPDRSIAATDPSAALAPEPNPRVADPGPGQLLPYRIIAATDSTEAPESVPSIVDPSRVKVGAREQGNDATSWWVGAAVVGGAVVTTIGLILLLGAGSEVEPTAHWALP
jgi:hypothetical protein